MPAQGQPMPEISLLNQDGNTVNLSDFRGKKIVLFAFPRADTPGCTTQACGFRDRYSNILTKNAVVFGLSPDKPADLKKWQEKEGFQYDLLSDPEHTVLEALGAWGERSMYGKKFMGVIRSHWVIDEDGNVLDEQIKVSPEDSVKKAYDLVTK